MEIIGNELDQASKPRIASVGLSVDDVAAFLDVSTARVDRMIQLKLIDSQWDGNEHTIDLLALRRFLLRFDGASAVFARAMGRERHRTGERDTGSSI